MNHVLKNEQNQICRSKGFLQLLLSSFFCRTRFKDSKPLWKRGPTFYWGPKLGALTVLKNNILTVQLHEPHEPFLGRQVGVLDGWQAALGYPLAPLELNSVVAVWGPAGLQPGNDPAHGRWNLGLFQVDADSVLDDLEVERFIGLERQWLVIVNLEPLFK